MVARRSCRTARSLTLALPAAARVDSLQFSMVWSFRSAWPTAELERHAAARASLLLNHVLLAEPVAMQRLQSHAGRLLEVRLHASRRALPGRAMLRITRAGLLEPADDGPIAAPDLHVAIDLGSAACALIEGPAPAHRFVEAQGDPALAGDVIWLFDTVRWDVGADLERLAGPAVAGAIERGAAAVAKGVRETLRAFAPPRPR